LPNSFSAVHNILGADNYSYRLKGVIWKTVGPESKETVNFFRL